MYILEPLGFFTLLFIITGIFHLTFIISEMDRRLFSHHFFCVGSAARQGQMETKRPRKKDSMIISSRSDNCPNYTGGFGKKDF